MFDSRIARLLASAGLVTLLAGAPAALGQPKFIVTGISSDLAATGDGVSGLVSIDLTGPYSDFSTVPIVWRRGVGYSIVPGAVFKGGVPGVFCSSDLSVLAMTAENTSNWGDLNCFNGYDTMTGDELPQDTPPCDPFGIAHRWTAGTGWVNTGSFPRFPDPMTGRMIGGTSCDLDINSARDISADGRYVLGNGWSARATNLSGTGISTGRCGDFYPFVYDGLTQTLTQLAVQPGTTTSRADYINADGTVVTGYDLGVSEADAPAALASGDFNGDGVLDLAVANRDTFRVAVLLGNADGTFQAALNFEPEIGELRGIAAADVNGDMITDLVVTGGTFQAKVLLGQGDGTFAVHGGFIFPGSQPGAIAIGDMNGDAIPDLVIANRTANTVAVLLGTGTGAFGAATAYAVGTTPSGVALGHFNGGTALDVVVANQCGNTISVLLGNGNGTLQAAQTYAVGVNPTGVAVGDVNGDGSADLVVANRGGNTVSVLLGTGTGTFGAAAGTVVGEGPSAVAIGLMDAGSVPDLVVTNSRDNTVSVLRGNGNGTFQAPQSQSTGQNPIGVVIGSFGTGSTNDVAVANFRGGGVSVLVGNGDGTLQARADYSTASFFFNSNRRTVVWRNGVQTILDPYLGAKDNAAISGPGHVVAQGASTEFVASTFPCAIGVRLVRWTYDSGNWVPENLGRPVDLAVDGGGTVAFSDLWATGVSADGNTIVGTALYGPPPPFLGGIRRPFIWRPSINGGVPMDLQAYLNSVTPGGEFLPAGMDFNWVEGVSADGNAVLVTILNRRNTCTLPSESLVTFAAGVIYLDGSSIACDPPRIGVGPEDWTADSDGPFGVALNVLASGSWPLTYQWQREDPNAPGVWVDLSDSCSNFDDSNWDFEGTQTVQLRIGQHFGGGGRGGRYRVVISNSCGSVASEPATVSFVTGACCFFGFCVPMNYESECLAIAGEWGGAGSVCGPNDECPSAVCPGDYNGDGVVDLADLLDFLGAWNPNLGQNVTPGTNGDVNEDGVVDLADLLSFLGDWNPNLGQTCP